MGKPIIRWTIGNSSNHGYNSLYYSIKSVIDLYSYEFEYFVCYNDVNLKKIDKIRKKYKINFLEQKWDDCPVKLDCPVSSNKRNTQILNGSFWKICPPRLSRDTHEIMLDNDLIFLKRPKAIDYFLSKKNKNLIIQDSNIYLGAYQELFTNEKQGYNSGLIGLCPNYDFKKDIIKNFQLIESEYNLDYGEEQGLLMYCLYLTDPIIGSSEDFVGIHPEYIYINCLSSKFSEYKLEKQQDLNKNLSKKLNNKILKRVFQEAEVLHFLRLNRSKNHIAWNSFKTKFI